MSSPELIEQAQARLYARVHNWTAFAKSVGDVANKTRFVSTHRSNSDWISELWFEFALGQEQHHLAELSRWLVDNRERSSLRLPTLSSLVDAAAKEPRLQWILSRDDLHDIWVAGTDVPVPNKEWRSRYHTRGDVMDAYSTWMGEQPESVQMRQKEYLAKYGNEAMHSRSLLYHAMCVYAEPTPAQVRGAALANNPIYDMARLETHYPGFAGLKATYEGMGMKQPDLRQSLCHFMDGTTTPVELAIPDTGFDAH